MARFLMATIPFAGHVNPGLPIARKLVERGHDVRWYTGERYRAKVEATGAKYLPMRNGYDYDDRDVSAAFPGRESLTGIAQLKFDMKHVFADAAKGQLADLEAILEEFPADVIMSDTAFVGAPLLQEKRGIAWATFGVMPLTLSSRDTAPFGLALMPSQSSLGRLRNQALHWFVNHVLFRDVKVHWQRLRRDLGFPLTLGSFLDVPLSPFLYMQPTIPSFEYPRSDLPPQVHFIGPFLPDPPANWTPPAWWDELLSTKQRVVHVTQGTVATDPDELIIPTIRALADEDVLVIATTGGQPVESVKLDPLPANVRLESFIPHYHLLPHVDAMITNAGYGGVQIALANGVPLVAAGASEDKPEVANRVAWSGAGINLRTAKPSPKQIRAAINRVLYNPHYRYRAEQLEAEIARHNAATDAAVLLEELATTRQPVMRHAVEAQGVQTLVRA